MLEQHEAERYLGVRTSPNEYMRVREWSERERVVGEERKEQERFLRAFAFLSGSRTLRTIARRTLLMQDADRNWYERKDIKGTIDNYGYGAAQWYTRMQPCRT
ncbi:uncharacterized protein LOC114255256 [Monomorium pharaonis]|uniref:uncharacterized protein LOC114255256 n=1 Tax=Monomorium pharaonis TaxID=307658 RepID=UPI00102E1D3D|nr:uncharacterized protein LOC114255256 [Monomorium pharaonis]